MKIIQLNYIIFVILIILAGSCRKELPSANNNTYGDNPEQVIYVTYPLFGSVYNPGDTLTVIWESSLSIKKVNVKLFKEEELQGVIANQISNELQFKWVIPFNFIPSTYYKIKVESVNNPAVYNYSSVFSILLY